MGVVLSGLPGHFFDLKISTKAWPSKRQRFLQLDETSPHTLIFYESPYRIKAFLADALAVYGDRDAAIGNELTKMYEGMEHGCLSELLALFEEQEPRGEYVVVIAGAANN